MSDVNTKDARIIEDEGDIIDLYQGVGDNIKSGLEMELCLFDATTPNIPPMNYAQNTALKATAKKEIAGDWLHNEPTNEVLEIVSTAAPLDQLETILNDTNLKLSTMARIAGEMGLKRSYFSEFPQFTGDDLHSNLSKLERYQAFFNPYRSDMQAMAHYFFVCKSNQISVGYRNPDHLAENIRRLYFLAPFLFMLTDNSSGFDQGKPCTGHSGMLHRAGLGKRGAVPDYIFTAKDGNAMVRAHIHDVFNNDLYVHYDENGELERIPAGQWLSVEKLRARGLNNMAHYFFSQSVLWPDVKIAGLRDENDNVYNHRFEARMFGVGIHQHQTAQLITAGLAHDQSFANTTDALLEKYGFINAASNANRTTVKNAYEAAKHHDNKFMDIPFGTGQLSDFAKEFAELLEAAYPSGSLREAISPALHICRTGMTDGKANRILFPTLEETIDHQRNFDVSIFDNPNQCAAMLFADRLKGRTTSLSKAAK